MAAGLGILLLIVAALLGLRERALYSAQSEGVWTHGTDLFVYTKGRFGVRCAGLFTAAILGAALVGWELWPPVTPGGLMLYVAVFGTASLGLIATVIIDIVMTARTARPEDLTRQGDPVRRKHNQSPHPP